MLTYNEARELMRKARHGRRKLENNTWLERRTTDAPKDGTYESDFAVRLHNTYVVTIHPDGSYTLNSGGWRTVTTKARINAYSPHRVYSDKGAWYLYPVPYGAPIDWTRRFPFADGMRVYASGKVEGAGVDETAIRRDLLKQIRAYIEGFARHAVENGLADPSSGDCWGCCMVDANAKQGSGRAPWGQDKCTKPGADHMMGLDHIFLHFKEKYYVPSLAWRAMQRRGDPGVCYRMAQEEAKRGDARILKQDLRAYFKALMPALVAEKAAK